MDAAQIKPETIAFNYAEIPRELRNLPNWVTWRYDWIEPRQEWAKVPHVASLEASKARSNDPSTWRAASAASQWAPEEHGGIGFCFSGGYCGVDLDGAVDSSGQIKPWAQKILTTLTSYSELSPSGEGIHVILLLTGPLPKGRRKRGGKKLGWEIGIYDSGRFFAMTGILVGPKSPIHELDVREFYEGFRSGAYDGGPLAEPRHHSRPRQTQPHPPGAISFVPRLQKFDQLYRGNWQGLGYASQSEADLALVTYLCRIARTPAEVDRLFRKSGLMRDKWDEPRPGGTYGSLTIARTRRL